jgi:hypothetical protein
MRVMVLVKADENSEAGLMPSPELLEAMMNYNEELSKAGVLVAGDGLKPSSQGVRIHCAGESRTVIDGPFAETKELVAGYWIWEVKDMAEAITLAKRCPNPQLSPSDLEIRPIFEMEDFADVASAAVVEQSERIGAQMEAKHGNKK